MGVFGNKGTAVVHTVYCKDPETDTNLCRCILVLCRDADSALISHLSSRSSLWENRSAASASLLQMGVTVLNLLLFSYSGSMHGLLKGSKWCFPRPVNFQFWVLPDASQESKGTLYFIQLPAVSHLPKKVLFSKHYVLSVCRLH